MVTGFYKNTLSVNLKADDVLTLVCDLDILLDLYIIWQQLNIFKALIMPSNGLKLFTKRLRDLVVVYTNYFDTTLRVNMCSITLMRVVYFYKGIVEIGPSKAK